MAAQENEERESPETMRDYYAFSELSPYAMAWLLLRKLSGSRHTVWQEYQRAMTRDHYSPRTAARALRIWLEYDLACESARKLMGILRRFHRPDAVDKGITARALQEGVEWSENA